MYGRDRIGNNHSANEQLRSGSERVQFGGGLAQSSSGQSSSSDMAIQMLLNKTKREVKNKSIGKEEQKREAEKALESIRIFNQINEEIKKSYDEQEANMRESLLKAEANYLTDEDGESSRDGEPSRDGESSRDRDKDKDSDSDSSKDSDSSDEDVYSKKPKTNSSFIRCEECNEELTQKKCGRHIQLLKHKKE